jgi:hypothetical protein
MCIQTHSHHKAIQADGLGTGLPQGVSAPVEITAVNLPEQTTADMSQRAPAPDEHAFELLQESA